MRRRDPISPKAPAYGCAIVIVAVVAFAAALFFLLRWMPWS